MNQKDKHLPYKISISCQTAKGIILRWTELPYQKYENQILFFFPDWFSSYVPLEVQQCGYFIELHSGDDMTMDESQTILAPPFYNWVTLGKLQIIPKNQFFNLLKVGY